MDYSILFTPPVLGLTAVVAILALIIGYLVGKGQENRRKEQSLAEAAEKARQVLDKQRRELELRIETAEKAYAADIEKLRADQQAQLEQLNKAQQELVTSLKESHAAEMRQLESEHAVLVEKLNSDNNASLKALQEAHEAQLKAMDERAHRLIEELDKRRKAELQQLREEQARAMAALKEDLQRAAEEHRHVEEELRAKLRDERNAHVRAMGELRVRLGQEVKTFRQERDRLAQRVGELEQALQEKINEMREAKLRNMFSVSRSGEKLIKVVRSVQELATELDETSRAVTDGDYSFFEQIKDQRDRETVLRLAAGAGGGPDVIEEGQGAGQPAESAEGKEVPGEARDSTDDH